MITEQGCILWLHYGQDDENDKEMAFWKKWDLSWVVDHGHVEGNQVNEQLFQAQRSEEEWYYLRREIKP